MKKITLLTALVGLTVLLTTGKVFAGPPFNNLEGVGGVAFNPLAYPAEGDPLYKVGDTEVISTPRFGSWYVNLPTAKINWESFGAATTLFKRLEISEGFENVDWENGSKFTDFRKNNIGAKLEILPENSFDTKFLPAISVGTIYKTTSDKYIHEIGLTNLRGSGEDWYAVATKTITQLPLPVILSGGVLSSQEFVTGVLGFDNKRKTTGFGNVDVVLPHNIVVGYEFKQGEHYNDGYKNANYWDAHVAWLANKNLTLIAAFTATGDYIQKKPGETRQGLGNGLVLSAQYAF